MTECTLGYIPERLHTNDKPLIETFSIGEFLYRRCRPEEIDNPFASISISELSHNRSGPEGQDISRPEDVLYNIQLESELQYHTDKVVCVLRIETLTLEQKYRKQFEETKNDNIYTSIMELLHDPESCMYPHCVFRIWVNDVQVTLDNYKENLKKLNVIRNSLKEELAFMIVKKIISQDSFPNIQ